MESSLLDRWHLLSRILDDRRLSKGDAAVARVLLDYATDDRGAWPSLDTIAGATSLSRRTVIESTGRLVETGYFTREIGGGRKNTNVYWPRYETVSQSAPIQAGNSEPECTDTQTETVNPSTQNSAPQFTRTPLRTLL